MKSIKLVLISFLFVPLLTNCGDDKKSASTPKTEVTEFCQNYPHDYRCQNTGNHLNQKIVLGDMVVQDIDLYEKILKTYKNCNFPVVAFNGSVESAIFSLLASASNRCTRWKTEPARIELYYGQNNQVKVDIYARSDYASVRPGLIYSIHSTIEARNQNQDFFINLEGYNQGRNGLILYGEGDPHSPNFRLSLAIDGHIVGTARMAEYNQNQQYQYNHR